MVKFDLTQVDFRRRSWVDSLLRQQLVRISSVRSVTNPVNHEEALVKAFIPSHRQERFLEIIAKPKKRAKLLTELSHFKVLNPKFMVAIPSNRQPPLLWRD